MKNRLHNPCTTCQEYDFCQLILPCERRKEFLQKREQIRVHMFKIMERAKNNETDID